MSTTTRSPLRHLHGGKLASHIQYTAAICCKRNSPACELTATVTNAPEAARYFEDKGWRVIAGVVTCPSCVWSDAN